MYEWCAHLEENHLSANVSMRKMRRFAGLWIYLGKFLSLYWSIGDLITGIQILTVICMGVLFTVDGNLTVGEFIAFVSYNSSMAWPVRSLGRIISEMSKAGRVN